MKSVLTIAECWDAVKKKVPPAKDAKALANIKMYMHVKEAAPVGA